MPCPQNYHLFPVSSYKITPNAGTGGLQLLHSLPTKDRRLYILNLYACCACFFACGGLSAGMENLSLAGGTICIELLFCLDIVKANVFRHFAVFDAKPLSGVVFEEGGMGNERWVKV